MSNLACMCLILCILNLCNFNNNVAAIDLCQISDCTNKDKTYPPTMKIKLLSDFKDKKHMEINKRFKEKIDESGVDINITYIKIKQAPLKNILMGQNRSKGDIVLHLYVKDFYKHNYNDIIKQNFSFAGNIGPKIKKEVCRSQTMEGTERCKESTETQRYVKLVKNTIYQHRPLLEFVNTFDGKHGEIEQCTNIREDIVVCEDINYVTNLKRRMISNINSNKIKIVESAQCETAITERTLVVLAPKPLQLDHFEQLYTPIIFYDHNYMLPITTDDFVNGFPLVNPTKVMKFAFLHFLHNLNWFRVGIISDDSMISQEFERDITSLFEKENCIYGSLGCADPNCNFNEVFNHFFHAQARVVIANVAEEFADTFVSKVAESKLGGRNIAWLVRDWSPKVAKKAARKIGHIFSITLGPEEYNMKTQDWERQQTDKSYTFVVDPLSVVADNIDEITYSRGVSKQRANAEKIKSWMHENVETYAYVRRYNEDNTAELIAKMHNPSKYNLGSPDVFKSHAHQSIEPELTDCIFKNKVYFKPCDDIDIMLLMLVCSISFLTSLGIIYFFLTCDRSYSRMEC